MSAFLLFIIITLVQHSESITCSGDCTCPGSNTGNTCILSCSSQGACRDGTLTCRTGDPCIIECTGDHSCEDAIIDGSTATDVTAYCDVQHACQMGTLNCGSGDCTLECQATGSAGCNGLTITNNNGATNFDCTGVDCNTISIQTVSPTKAPTEMPTKNPTPSPTENPTPAPTTNPTKNPTPAPTENPTNSPTVDPTIDPTNDPTSDPTHDPTQDPTYDPIGNVSYVWQTSDDTTFIHDPYSRFELILTMKLELLKSLNKAKWYFIDVETYTGGNWTEIGMDKYNNINIYTSQLYDEYKLEELGYNSSDLVYTSILTIDAIRIINSGYCYNTSNNIHKKHILQPGKQYKFRLRIVADSIVNDRYDEYFDSDIIDLSTN
eukprot:105266_1